MIKNIAKLCFVFILIICVSLLSACNGNLQIDDKQTINLSETEITLSVGKTAPLLIETTPEDIKDEITWKSSDENVAKYFGGEVLAKNKGTCEITATTPDGTSAICKITVSAKIVDSGSCGENVAWAYYEDYSLVISGTGDMDEYYQPFRLNDPLNKGKVPWVRYNKLIKEIVIQNGVTSICRYAFSFCNFEAISIPSSVTKIGFAAFYGVRSAPNIIIHKNVQELGVRVLSGSNAVMFYESTEKDFNKILKHEIDPTTHNEIKNVGGDIGSKVLFYSEQQKENCWRYVDGIPTAW